MKLWTRLMMIVATCFLAAQPVMACPLMLGDASAASVSVDDGHPCSDMAKDYPSSDNLRQMAA